MSNGRLVCADKLIFVNKAKRAFKVIGQIGKWRVGFDSALRKSFAFIINPAAQFAYVFHGNTPPQFVAWDEVFTGKEVWIRWLEELT